MSAALHVAIGSLGTVGLAVARRLQSEGNGLVLTAVSARDEERAWRRLESLGSEATPR